MTTIRIPDSKHVLILAISVALDSYRFIHK